LKINQHLNYNHAMQLHLILCSHSNFELSFCFSFICLFCFFSRPFYLSFEPTCSLLICVFLQKNAPYCLLVGNFKYFTLGVQIFIIKIFKWFYLLHIFQLVFPFLQMLRFLNYLVIKHIKVRYIHGWGTTTWTMTPIYLVS